MDKHKSKRINSKKRKSVSKSHQRNNEFELPPGSRGRRYSKQKERQEIILSHEQEKKIKEHQKEDGYITSTFENIRKLSSDVVNIIYSNPEIKIGETREIVEINVLNAINSTFYSDFEEIRRSIIDLGFINLEEKLIDYCKEHKLEYGHDIVLVFKGGNIFRHYFTKINDPEIKKLIDNLSDYDFQIYTKPGLKDKDLQELSDMISFYLVSNMKKMEGIILASFEKMLNDKEKFEKFVSAVGQEIEASEYRENGKFINFEQEFKRMKVKELYILGYNIYIPEKKFEKHVLGKNILTDDLDTNVSFKISINPEERFRKQYKTMTNTVSKEEIKFDENYVYFSISDRIRNIYLSPSEFILQRVKLAGAATGIFYNEKDTERHFNDLGKTSNYSMPLNFSADVIDISIACGDDTFNQSFLNNIAEYSNRVSIQKVSRQNLTGNKEILIYKPEYLLFDLYNVLFYNSISIYQDPKYNKRLLRMILMLILSYYTNKHQDISERFKSLITFLDELKDLVGKLDGEPKDIIKEMNSYLNENISFKYISSKKLHIFVHKKYTDNYNKYIISLLIREVLYCILRLDEKLSPEVMCDSSDMNKDDIKDLCDKDEYKLRDEYNRLLNNFGRLGFKLENVTLNFVISVIEEFRKIINRYSNIYKDTKNIHLSYEDYILGGKMIGGGNERCSDSDRCDSGYFKKYMKYKLKYYELLGGK